MANISNLSRSLSYQIVSFAPEHAAAFKNLNLNWIRQHWKPEAADYKALDNPQENIIDTGGFVAIAVDITKPQHEAIGTCALLKIDAQNYELAKMSVADAAKGQGIGRALGEAVIAQARSRGAKRLYLESNTVLKPALNLYQQLGFREFTGAESPYQRCNVQMELLL